MLPNLFKCKIGIIGLGYVGLPLAVEFAKAKKCLRSENLLAREVIGFDINKIRLEELRKGYDRTNEISSEDLLSAKNKLTLSNNEKLLSSIDVYIVTVPTPIDSDKKPDLKLIKNATETIGNAIKSRSLNQKRLTKGKSSPIIIYESTVFPGTTEDICMPILENTSGLKANIDFFCGYSPERINPADKHHTLTNIIKVTSGSNVEVTNWVDDFYGSIIKAGTYKAASLKIAETSKVIENTQRDLNIALVNELAMICKKLNISTLDVLKAAETKWNFLPFRPGLVGGHCIGVDPYYLTYKSEQMGYSPQVVLAGRRINESMPNWLAKQILIELKKRKKILKNSKVLILGLTFKENCPDLRNTLVINLIDSLSKLSIYTEIIDPKANAEEAKKLYNIRIESEIPKDKVYSAIIGINAHSEFLNIKEKEWKKLIEEKGFFLDLKGIFPEEVNPIKI
tara:strand:+ start:4848 stop:6206 length:1359 start_codon:yes stop_codon:yes gene_type:complete